MAKDSGGEIPAGACDRPVDRGAPNGRRPRAISTAASGLPSGFPERRLINTLLCHFGALDVEPRRWPNPDDRYWLDRPTTVHARLCATPGRLVPAAARLPAHGRLELKPPRQKYNDKRADQPVATENRRQSGPKSAGGMRWCVAAS